MKALRVSVWLVVGLMALLSVACSTPDPTTGDEPYAITVAWEPATPTVNNENVLTVTVKDKDGKAVTGATVTVDPQMPAHGHGSSKKVTVTDEGEGKYKATPVWFQMKGEWEITITVKAGETTGTKKVKVTI